MNKTQMGRVQCLTGEVPGLEQVRQRLSGAAIDRVADERVADMRHMDAHLMGTAGFEAAFDERGAVQRLDRTVMRSEEHTSELQSLMRISYAVFCLKKKKKQKTR